jgi:hypothetical protein
MNTIGLAGIQKNISILNNLSEPLKVVDQRKKEAIAIIYPIKKRKNNIASLAGKYSSMIPEHLKNKNIDTLIDTALEQSLIE